MILECGSSVSVKPENLSVIVEPNPEKEQMRVLDLSKHVDLVEMCIQGAEFCTEDDSEGSI